MTILTWIRNIAILVLSLFFLIIGINTLVGSYQLNNPYTFVMYFFSASMLILVSIAGLIYFFFKTFYPKQKNEINDDESK